jgi:L-histidine Nalpha-methyltransferase / hercynylcysteine S-oxide synthase
MLIQRAGTGTLPPPGFTTPPWSCLSDEWARLTPSLSSPTTILGPATITLGHDDSEADDLLPKSIFDVDDHEFGWDNESPARAVEVGKFEIEWRPVSNAEFSAFWRGDGHGKVDMPKSWVNEHGEIKVYLHFVFICNSPQLIGWQVRTLYGPVSMEIAREWPVLTAYDDLLLYARHKGGRIPTEPELRLFFDTYEVGHSGGANVSFRNWHPIP